MPEYQVPALVQVRGIMIVSAKNREEALKKAEADDTVDCDVNHPIDIMMAETDCCDPDVIERYG